MLKKYLAVFGLLFGLSCPVLALEAAKEYEIKAAFLFNLGSFITWPDTIFESENSPFHICVLGTDPFGEILDIISTNQKILGHPLSIFRFEEIDQAGDCEVLFISSSEQLHIQTIFDKLKNRPILTVSDMDNFVARGGMVQFFPRDNKIRLMLDPDAFIEAGLKPSSHLMRVAQIVNHR